VLCILYIAGCYGMLGLYWGILAKSAWTAIAGALALGVLSINPCFCCLLPLLFTVQSMSKGDLKRFIGAIAVPAVITGPAFLATYELPGALDAMLMDGLTSSGVETGLSLFYVVAHGFVFAHRWRNAPVQLDREMARASEGDDGFPSALRGVWVAEPPVVRSRRSLIDGDDRPPGIRT
jgi:hypothetical protein